MTEKPEPQALAELPPSVLDEVIRQFRAARNDILRYGVWNVRNLADEDFGNLEDQQLFDYFKQDLLETRFVDRGRRVDIIQTWEFFDHQLNGTEPLLLNGEEMFLNIQDKDIEKLRKRVSELRSFIPSLRNDDIDTFRKVKYKLRRTVMRLTYDIHHLNKRLEKYRKQRGVVVPAVVASSAESPSPSEPEKAAAE